MSEWLDMKGAPKDGSWLILEGEFEGGDTSTVRVGRWKPRTFPIGTYEWEVVESIVFYFDETTPVDNIWNWYPEGRVHGWLPLKGNIR